MAGWVRSNILFFIPLALVAFYYTVQNLLGLMVADARLVVTFLAIILLSAAFYTASYIWLPVGWVRSMSPVKLKPRGLEIAAIAGALSYLLIISLAVCSADRVAMFAALQGAGAAELAEYRETFLRTRTGSGQVLHYLYVMFNNSVMPFAVAYGFYGRKKWRHVVLALFVFGLSLTLQKGAVTAAGLPLLILFLLQRRYLAAVAAAVMVVVVVGFMYQIASGRMANIASEVTGVTEPEIISHHPEEVEAARAEITTLADQMAETLAKIETAAVVLRAPITQTISDAAAEAKRSAEDIKDAVSRDRQASAPQVANASSVPAKYNIFGSNNQVALILNRIFWIPYITAIDWIKYREQVLNGEMALGRSIKPIAAITGQEYLNLEREVARLQWGQNEQGTASSNAIYVVDAWVNFGALGVILYSVLLGLAVKLIVSARSLPLTAAAVTPVFLTGFVGLPPVMLSGGLAVILLLAIVAKPTQEAA